MTDAITPFHLAVPETELDDLRDRLARTRWAEAETVDDWSQGVPRACAPAAARSMPRAQMGVRRSGPIQAHALEALDGVDAPDGISAPEWGC